MKTSLWLLLLFLALSISSGCAVYRQSDELGSSEFALYYGRNYRYRETTPSGKTCIKGQYTVRDSTIKFDLKHRDPVPYNYLRNTLAQSEPAQDTPGAITLLVVDEQVAPLAFAIISVMDEYHRYIAFIETNMEGKVILPMDTTIAHLHISYFSQEPRLFDYQQLLNGNKLIRLVSSAQNDHTDFGCFGGPDRKSVSYRVDNPKGITTLTLDGVVFRRVRRWGDLSTWCFDN